MNLSSDCVGNWTTDFFGNPSNDFMGNCFSRFFCRELLQGNPLKGFFRKFISWSLQELHQWVLEKISRDSFKTLSRIFFRKFFEWFRREFLVGFLYKFFQKFKTFSEIPTALSSSNDSLRNCFKDFFEISWKDSFGIFLGFPSVIFSGIPEFLRRSLCECIQDSSNASFVNFSKDSFRNSFGALILHWFHIKSLQGLLLQFFNVIF